MSRKDTLPCTSVPGPEDLDLYDKSGGLRQAGSAPNLSNSDKDLTPRFKRKRDDELVLMDEIRGLLATSAAQSDSKFAALQSAVAEIIAQNVEIKDSIAFTSKQYDDVLIKLEKLESERKAERCYVQQLETKLEHLERQLNVTKVEIKNIPRTQDETKEDIRNIVTKTASIIELPIQAHDIKDVYRSGKRDDPAPPIVVDFSSVITKDNLIKKARQYNTRNSQNKLSTAHLKIEGPARAIYVAERLTPHGQRMHYLARTFARDHRYKHCWTSYGRVFLRKEDGGQHVPIDVEADLAKLQDWLASKCSFVNSFTIEIRYVFDLSLLSKQTFNIILRINLLCSTTHNNYTHTPTKLQYVNKYLCLKKYFLYKTAYNLGMQIISHLSLRKIMYTYLNYEIHSYK